ncbi:MAG: MATE family efflux transporter [Verrucomicrobia bacterium]|nr:MATE family efflux transporter [Verrucomicrobiota bacterium]
MQSQGSITRFPAGSFREVCAIGLPLMLAMMSTSLMMFCDRLVLAHYSTAVMNATVVMWEVAAVFHFLPVGTAMIIEVFVGRCNGANRLQEAGAYTWQMIWFSLATFLAFLPLSYFGATAARAYLPGVELGIPYFQWILLFGPIFSLSATLNAFFVGLGKVRLVTAIALLSNGLNIGLDCWFVFGLDLGAKGAALATGISQILSVLILAYIFLKQTTYGSKRWQLQPKLLWETLRIGVPSAVGHLIEIAAWATLMQMLIVKGTAYITVTAVGQGFFFLFTFLVEGLQKSVATLGANFLGAKRKEVISRLLRSAVLLHLLLLAALAIPLLVYTDVIVRCFLPDTSESLLTDHTILALYWVWAYFLLDGLAWVFAGIVTAGGDTRFVMMTNGLAAWIFAIVPNYIGLYWFDMSPAWVWPLKVIYPLVNVSLFYWRYRSGKWIKEIISPNDLKNWVPAA